VSGDVSLKEESVRASMRAVEAIRRHLSVVLGADDLGTAEALEIAALMVVNGFDVEWAALHVIGEDGQ
jgi:hypothetical protein